MSAYNVLLPPVPRYFSFQSVMYGRVVMNSMMPGTTASQSCDSMTSTTWLFASGWYLTRISPTTPTRTLRGTSFNGRASKLFTISRASTGYGR